MTEEEAGFAFEKIADMLWSTELKWVLEQVEESIILGKTVTTTADASEFIDDKVAGPRRGKQRMQEFITTRSFSSMERLNLLLDAIDRVVALPQFSTGALNMLNTPSVTFVSDRPIDEGRRLKGGSGAQDEARLRLRDVRQQIVEA